MNSAISMGVVHQLNDAFVQLCLQKHSCTKDLQAFLSDLTREKEAVIDWNWVHSLSRLTPLVACSDRIDMVRFCIEHGSDVDFLGAVNRLNLLHITTMKCQLDVVQYIVDLGGNVNCYNDMTCSVLMEACVVKDVELVNLLLAAGVCIDTQSQYGTTALMFASKQGCLDIVQGLMDRSANLSLVTTTHHWTAIKFAQVQNHVHIVQYLLTF